MANSQLQPRVSVLKKSLRPLFKDRLKLQRYNWSNVKSDEKERALILSIVCIDGDYFSECSIEGRERLLELQAEINSTIQHNIPGCDIQFRFEWKDVSINIKEAN